MGLSAGIGAVGIGVSVVKVKPTLNTTVGVDGAAGGTTSLTGIQTVNIANDVKSAAESSLVSAAAGGVSVGVNVMNAYNDTVATAKAANLSGTIDGLNISGQLGAKGISRVGAASYGGVGIGVAVNYVDVNAKNKAEADLTNGGLTINDKLSVTTGDSEYSRQTSAEAWSLSAAAGLGVVAVNTAIARNRAVNEAIISGGTVNAKDVVLNSYSRGTANAELLGSDVGSIKIAVAVVNARNEATSHAKMNLTGALKGDLTVRSDVQGDTKARLLTGSGSLLAGVDTNVVTSHGDTSALADITIGGDAGKKQKIDSKVTGRDTVKTTIENLLNLNLGLSVATMVGGAHSKDVYDNKVTLKNGTCDLPDISVTTDYAVNVDSDVTPSTAGVVLSTVGVSVNRSSATSAAYAGAMLTLEDAKAGFDGDLNVKTTGTTAINAVVKPASFDWNLAVGVGANKARAESKGTQAATLKLLNGHVTRAKAVNVESVIKAADVQAIVSANGKDKNADSKRVKIGAVSVEANTADASQNIASTAAILGGGGIPVMAPVLRYDVYSGNKFVGRYSPDEFKSRYSEIIQNYNNLSVQS